MTTIAVDGLGDSLVKMNQSELTNWTSGLFDAEGTITGMVERNERQETGHMFRSSVQIHHAGYVGGFFDGEGIVRVQPAKTDDGKTNHAMEPFCGMWHSDEDPIIERLEEFSRMHDITSTISSHEKGGGDNHDQFYWQIRERESVERFCREIMKYTVVKRPQLGIMLNEILPRMAEKKHTHKRGFLEVMAWKDIMDAYKGGSRGKYNLQYFEDLWDVKLDKARAGLPDDWEPDYSRPKMGDQT